MKKVFLCFCLTMLAISLPAQTGLSETLGRLKFQPTPYNDDKGKDYYAEKLEGTLYQSYGISNTGYRIPDRLYDNLQLTQYTLARTNEELGPAMTQKFRIHNSRCLLALINFGGATDYSTDVLATIDHEGNVSDTLEAKVLFGNICMKEFSITTGCQAIIVRQLVPVSEKSISFSDFVRNHQTEPVEFYRLDTRYEITPEGKFKKVNEKKWEKVQATAKKLENPYTSIGSLYLKFPLDEIKTELDKKLEQAFSHRSAPPRRPYIRSAVPLFYFKPLWGQARGLGGDRTVSYQSYELAKTSDRYSAICLTGGRRVPVPVYQRLILAINKKTKQHSFYLMSLVPTQEYEKEYGRLTGLLFCPRNKRNNFSGTVIYTDPFRHTVYKTSTYSGGRLTSTMTLEGTDEEMKLAWKHMQRTLQRYIFKNQEGKTCHFQSFF